MSIIIQKRSATCVDGTDYDLDLDSAAKRLHDGQDVVAREFEDYEDDFSFPDVVTLEAKFFKDFTIEQIIESLRGCYESFGSIPVTKHPL